MNGRVPGEGRFARIRGRMRSQGDDEDETKGSSVSSDEPVAAEPEPEPEPEPVDEDSGLAPLSLGDLDENRRESVARRLQALRERSPGRIGGDRSRGEGLRSAGRRIGARARSAGAVGRKAGAQAGPAAKKLSAGTRGAGAAAVAGGKRIGDAWLGVPTVVRVRVAAALIVAALVAVVLVVVVPAAPCQFPGGDSCPPSDDAIALVPDDALAYAHLDIDADGEQFQDASELASRVPLLSRLALGELAGVAGERVDFASQIRPWAGAEIALAVLPGSGALERVVMVEADDDEGAEAFAAALLGPRTSTEEIAGIEIAVTTDGAASAIVNGFLVLGDLGAVEGLIDPDEEATLESAAASTLLEEIPDDRIAYAYLSGEGARALLGAEGALSPFDTFVDSDASAGVTISLSAADDLIEVEVRSELDPELTESSPPFFAALPPYEPTLPEDVGSDALAYLGIGDPQASIETLLTRAAADAPALLGAFEGVEKDLDKAGVDVTGELLSLLGSEAAVTVEPVGAEDVEPPPGTIAPSGVPYLSLLARGVDTEEAARSLAALQAPLVDALAPAGSGKIASFETLRVAGVDAQSLLVNPDINLTYAIIDDLLVVATNPIAVEQARAEADGLEDSPEFDTVTEELPEEVSLLAYFDLRSLLALGEAIGLAADPAYATLAPDLRTLDAAAVAVSGSETEIRTDLRIAVGQPEAAETEADPLAGG